MKIISFAVPCYNSADYMDRCIESLLALDMDKTAYEIILVDDGSSDQTPQRADQWQERFPETIRVIHQENGGHGSAINAGLKASQACYFKVVDSDDWLDADAMKPIVEFLTAQIKEKHPCDLVIGNYVYEKLHENVQKVMGYALVFPEDRIFTFAETGHFKINQYLLMHSVIYRRELLQEIHLELPAHCFYVDNIFVYVPLPAVYSIRYFNVGMYRYYIGREGQSVEEATMLKRIDQQLRITRIMIDAIDTNDPRIVVEPKLRRYMENYLSMMMCICSVFLRMENTPESEKKRADIWNYLAQKRPEVYPRIRFNVLNIATNLPGNPGRFVGLGGYRLANRIFKFN